MKEPKFSREVTIPLTPDTSISIVLIDENSEKLEVPPLNKNGTIAPSLSTTPIL